jgi:hypothetical protein
MTPVSHQPFANHPKTADPNSLDRHGKIWLWLCRTFSRVVRRLILVYSW